MHEYYYNLAEVYVHLPSEWDSKGYKRNIPLACGMIRKLRGRVIKKFGDHLNSFKIGR